MNPIKTAVKCCGCIILTQLIWLLIVLGFFAALGLAFYLYVLPWGEDQIRDALGLASDIDISSLNASYIAANNCSGCVFGTNTDWPTNTTGMLHFLDTDAGSTSSAVIATSLAAAAVVGGGSMIWASIVPSMATALSFSSGFYEMTHIVEQAQFIGMISQLQITGAPAFLYEFSKELAWTNFNIPKSSSEDDANEDDDDSDADDESTRRLSIVDAASSTSEAGVERYAALLGVEPKNLFFYTLMTFGIVIGAIHALFIVGVTIASCFSKEPFNTLFKKWYRKVIWASVLALLLAQYTFSMAGCYYVYLHAKGTEVSSFSIGIAALIAIVAVALLLGILVVANNTDELKDVGTFEHDQRPFSAKYSAYYDEYNFDNRFFFVPRILLAVSTGAVVGVVQDSTTQLLCIIGITLVYLVLLMAREPNLLRFLYYVGLASVFMKIVLVCLMLILAHDDVFPQAVRDNVSYAIIGVNLFIFFLLFLRQAYIIIHKIVRGCKHKKENPADSSTDINLEIGNSQRRGNYARMNSAEDFNNEAAYPMNSGHVQQNFNQQSQQYSMEKPTIQHMPYGQGEKAMNAAVMDTYGRETQRQQQQYQPTTDHPANTYGLAAAGGAVAASNARNNHDERQFAPQHTSPSAFQTYQPRQNRVSYAADRVSNSAMSSRDDVAANASIAAGASAAAVARNSKYDQQQIPVAAVPRRQGSINVDDIDIDELDATTGQTLAATAGAQQAKVDAFGKARKRRSFMEFSDDDDGSFMESPTAVSTATALGGADATQGFHNRPQSNFSDTSNFSNGSSDWFARRSKTEIEDDSDLTLLPHDRDVDIDGSFLVPSTAPSTALLAQRSSLDSYTTDSEVNPYSNRSSLTLVSESDQSRRSDNGTMDSYATDPSHRRLENDTIDSYATDPSHRRLGNDTIDSYGTAQNVHSDRSLMTMSSIASSTNASGVYEVGGLDGVAVAYLHNAGENTNQGENDLGDDDDEDDDERRQHESGGVRGQSESFMSAISADSSDDATYYIDGQHRDSSIALLADKDHLGYSNPQPKKL